MTQPINMIPQLCKEADPKTESRYFGYSSHTHEYARDMGEATEE